MNQNQDFDLEKPTLNLTRALLNLDLFFCDSSNIYFKIFRILDFYLFSLLLKAIAKSEWKQRSKKGKRNVPKMLYFLCSQHTIFERKKNTYSNMYVVYDTESWIYNHIYLIFLDEVDQKSVKIPSLS